MIANLNRLLLLEDDDRSASFLIRLAENKGYRVARACTIAEFKVGYVLERPSLIAMDLILGQEDCTGALRFLEECRNEVPIVLLTGHMRTFLDVIVNEAARLNQKIVERVEKRRSLFRFEDVLDQHRIAEIDLGDTAKVALELRK